MCRVAGEVADAVLFNWLTPEHARRSAEWVRAGAAAAGRQPPRLFAYVRVALGAAASDRLREEGVRYAAIPAYAAHFARMGVKPVETAIAASSAGALAAAIAVSTGFTPMRAKWAAYAGIAAYRTPSSRSRSLAAAPRATRTYAKSRGGCRPAAAAPARTHSAERRACSGVSQLKSTASATSPATRHI